MTDAEKRAAAKRFSADWAGRGNEKQETQAFWLTLLQKVCGLGCLSSLPALSSRRYYSKFQGQDCALSQLRTRAPAPRFTLSEVCMGYPTR